VGGATLPAGGANPWTSDSVDELRAIAWRLFRANEANPDPNTSVVVASATLLALLAQRRYGIGQQVFVDMLGANAYANADDFIQYQGKPERPTPDADLFGLSATYRLYPAKEGWVFLALPSDHEFERFCELAGESAVANDPRFSSIEGRRNHDRELSDALTKIFLEQTADNWELLLAPKGLGCVRADGGMPGEFWLNDAHARENGFVTEVEHPRFGRHLRPLSA
jgi:crotonobetainyl-CoA:carnitine CoA-transferase CaiB-like acyl-CoA transferase